MTQASSLTDTEPAPAQTVSNLARLERLEFGKFCVSPDGPVEKNRDNIPIGYSQLGWSAGFPEEIISFCDPKSTGISEGESEPLPTDSLHGTVLRPVIRGQEQKLRRVFYRVRMRAEEGEDRAGRRYTMARYLVTEADDIDPLTLLAAMNSVPLQGMTRAEASDILTLDVSPAELKPSGLVEAFLREAVIYVLSGIPLSITENISETDFFSCVAAVWFALPSALRPYLSAGWNVGSSFSGKLAVTHTAHRAGDAALFSPSDLSWSPPDYVTMWDKNDQPVRNSFFQPRLEPGRLYKRYIFGGDDVEYSVNFSPPPEKVLNLIGLFPSLNLQGQPDWHNLLVIRAFRYPGLKAKDQFAVQLLEQWLKNGKGEDNPPLCLDIRQFTYQSTRLNGLNLIIKALAKPFTRRRRGDLALWRSLSGGYPDSFDNLMNGATGDGADRARLIAALARHDVRATLDTLTNAAQRGEAEDLPVEAVSSLETCLDESIRHANREALYIHAHLLESPPACYRQWLRLSSRELHLMGALAAMPEYFYEEDYDRIVKINPSLEVRALNELRKGHEPSLSLQNFVRQLSGEPRNVFLSLFNQEWQRHDEDVAGRRERLLRWVEAVAPQSNSHPLLRLKSGEPLSEEEMDRLADEVEQGTAAGEREYIPPSLLPQVSALVLQQPRLLRRVRSRRGAWSAIHLLWPSQYARALVGGRGVDQQVHPTIMRAANEIKIPFDLLNDILNQQAVYARFNGVAPLIWEWSLLLTPREGYRPTVIDLCWHMAHGKLPNSTPEPIEMDLFARLAQESGKADQMVGSSQQLWASATRGWHLRLLLSLFPGVGFKPPSATQLGWLVEYRDWLNRHLNEPQIHPYRRDNFYVATREFHSLSFKSNATLWRDDFPMHSIIWAAFKGVPVALLKGQESFLRNALRAYTGSNPAMHTAEQSREIQERQASMCHIFLRAYEGVPSQYEALNHILFEFVFPLLSHRRTEERVKEIFSIVGSHLDLPDYARKVKHDHSFPQELYELLCTIVTLRDGKTMMQDISEYYRSRR